MSMENRYDDGNGRVIIAGMYEIERKIGSGGGGVVYLGRHLRLEKPVVLKADKRTLAAKPEALRREVDMLKGLSHTYIPQVYDFVEQDGVVYTVMDYIEGESLDKLLARKEPLSQPAQAVGTVKSASAQSTTAKKVGNQSPTPVAKETSLPQTGDQSRGAIILGALGTMMATVLAALGFRKEH